MSTDLTMEEAMRLQRFREPRPGPVRDLEDILTLLEIAGMCMSDGVAGSATFTTAELLAEASIVLEPGQFLAQGDVETVLPGMKCFRRVKGGWQWR